MDECGGLENRCPARDRRFESYFLRQVCYNGENVLELGYCVPVAQLDRASALKARAPYSVAHALDQNVGTRP